jgi:predicted glycosyltransferase
MAFDLPTAADRLTRRPFRVLTYSHDSYGLGHLRRSVNLASALVARGPHVHALCVTGSPVPDLFPLPARTDLVKLPSIGKAANGDYVARRLPLPIAEVTALRADLITAAVRSFRPDLVLVDHTAAGPGGELLPVLRRLRHEQLHTRVVLGLRDVLDSPLRARAELQRDDTFAVIRACYDHVLVYGDRDVFDPITEYGFPADLAAKTSFTGPVVPEAMRQPRQPRASGTPANLLVMTGGGEDGYELLRGTVAALRGPLRERELRATLVAGPLLAEAAFADLRRALHDDGRLVLRRTTDSMATLLADADLAIGMGGYNTVYESLASGTPLLALPRRAPREEQWERCRRLHARGLLHLLEAADLADPHATGRAIERALLAAQSQPPTPRPCDGAGVAARLCLRLSRKGHAHHSIAHTGS